jgi:glycine/D-amino acid oxidase-like deaminating enzyme
MSDAAYDVAIAGGGIVGSACALACARRGLSVVLAEADTLGSGATAAGMGHVVVMDDSEAQFALTRYAQNLWMQAAPTLPASVEYEQRGTLWIAADAEEMAAAERKHARYRECEVPCRLLTAAELAEAEPQLAAGFAGALLVSDDAVVYPPTAALTLAQRACDLGAALMLGARVKQLGAGRLVCDNGREVRAKHVVNALGARAVDVDPHLPIRKRKGHLVITDRYPGFLHHQLVELGYLKSAHASTADSVAFNVQPRQTGQLLIGSSRQFGSESSQVDQPILAAMLARAQQYLPGVAKLSAIRAWTGFRAASPDKLPLIGPDPRDETLLLATGHEGLGITTSLATAELIADLLTGGASAIPIEPYLPARFSESFQNPSPIASEEQHEVDWSHAGTDHGIR